MAKTQQWYEHLRSYIDIIALELQDPTSTVQLMEYISRNLRPCPYKLIIPNILIVPKEAIALLPLQDVPHTQVELRDMSAITDVVRREIGRRFSAIQEPHYYTTTSVVQPPVGQLAELLERTGREINTIPTEIKTAHRMYVRLSTVQEIERKMASKSI